MHEFGPALRDQWLIDPSITYLNHGTVGAPPRRVLDAQRAIRDEIERQPATFLLRELADVDADGTWEGPPPRLRSAAERVGRFLGLPGEEVLFVDNATTGANAVLRSFPFRAGDEILVTDLAYGGVVRAVHHVASGSGATVRTVTMPRPGAAPDAFVAAIGDAVSARTRMVLIDHITARTALVLPVREIADVCHAAGVPVLVDGAHAPGAIPLDIAALGVDWYFGNLHKWAWTPRSAGVLWVAPQHRAQVHPTVISWGYGNGPTAEFDLLGTRDPSAYLAAPVALDLMDEIGFERIAIHNHRLATDGATLLADRWGTDFETPRSMIGTMATVALPRRLGSTVSDARRLQASLLDDDRIEVPVFDGEDGLSLRVSAQVYLDLGDIERLAAAVGRRC